MARTLVIANRKGGSGKTTTAVNLADGLARKGKRILLIDADSQAQATISSGLFPHRLEKTLVEVFRASQSRGMEADLAQHIVSGHKRYDLLPSRSDLAAVELEMAGWQERESVFKDLVSSLDRAYDFILIDLPPALGLITVNGLVAGEGLLITVETSFLSMDGLAQMVGVLYRVNAQYNPGLELTGIVPVKYDPRTKLARSVVEEIKQNFGEQRLLPSIRLDVKLAEAPSFGETIFEYAPVCRGAEDYGRLADAVMARWRSAR